MFNVEFRSNPTKTFYLGISMGLFLALVIFLAALYAITEVAARCPA